MLQLRTVKQDAAQTLAAQTTPEEKARPRTLCIEALEERIAPAAMAAIQNTR
jgi:hypothetical protein